jgi:hypothetical protein
METIEKNVSRTKVQAGKKEFSFIQSASGDVVSYTLNALKQLGFSAKGMIEEGKTLLKCFGYDNNGMKYRFILVHLKTKAEYPVWASNGLKEVIEGIDSYKTSKNDNPYFKVPEELVSFYEVIDEDTKETGLIVGKRGEQDDAVIL